jgi:pyrimidine-nucleoside phosphorylase
VLSGQTDEIAPADRKLYALRDVTATVESIPFIAASIMSKKLAEGIDALVLDVKCGRGAFMRTEADARRLAEMLVAIGAQHNVPTVARLTAMDVPLGRAVGNWPEVAEAIACLRGERDDSRLMTLVTALAGEMIALGGHADTPALGHEQAREAVASGAALDRFRQLVTAQGGDPSVVDDPDTRPDSAPIATVRAPDDAHGHVADLDALAIGEAAVDLGAGRRTKEDAVDPVAGLSALKKPGDPVAPGDALAHLHASGTPDLDAVRDAVQRAYTFADAPPDPSSVLLGRHTLDGWDAA